MPIELDGRSVDRINPYLLPSKEKPQRYRWPDEIRDEVPARLLELNAQRAKEQAASSSSEKGPASSGVKKRGGRALKTPSSETQGALFDEESE